MKKETLNQFTPITKEQTEKLTTIVKETLDFEFTQSKPFSSYDLWNIQRKGRTMLQRRSFI